MTSSSSSKTTTSPKVGEKRKAASTTTNKSSRCPGSRRCCTDRTNDAASPLLLLLPPLERREEEKEKLEKEHELEEDEEPKPDAYGLLRCRRFLPMLAGHSSLLCPRAALHRLRTMTDRPHWVRRAVDGVEERAEVYYKYAPMLDPYYHLTGRYDVAERAEMPSNAYRAYVTRHQKIMDPMNSAAMDALGAHISGELFRQGLPTALESFGYRVGMKREFRFDVGAEFMYNCDEWDTPENEHRFAWYQKPEDYEERKADLADMKREEAAEAAEADRAANEANEANNEDEDQDEDDDCCCCEHCQMEGCQGECCDGDDLFDSKLAKAAAREKRDNNNDEEEDEYNEDDEPLDDGDWWSYSPGEATVDLFRIPVVMVGVEKCAGGTLEDYLVARNKKNAPFSEEETGALILQLAFTLETMQRGYQFVHGDLHLRNIMIVPTTLEHVAFSFDGVEYRVPTFGRLYKLIDFGRSSFVLDGRFFVSDAFAPHGDGSGMFNCGPSEDLSAPTVWPSRSFDLALLSGILFELMVGDAFMKSWAENGVLPAPLTPAQQTVYDWGIMSIGSGSGSSSSSCTNRATTTTTAEMWEADPQLLDELKICADEDDYDDDDEEVSFETRYLQALHPTWENQHSVFLPTGEPRFRAGRSFKINLVVARFAHRAVPEELLRRYLRPETKTWSFH